MPVRSLLKQAPNLAADVMMESEAGQLRSGAEAGERAGQCGTGVCGCDGAAAPHDCAPHSMSGHEGVWGRRDRPVLPLGQQRRLHVPAVRATPRPHPASLTNSTLHALCALPHIEFKQNRSSRTGATAALKQCH